MTATETTTLHIYSVTPKKSWGPLLLAVNPDNNTVHWIQLGPGTELHRFYLSDEEIPFDPALYKEVVRVA